ncbi:unnamed protein product [Arctogadus glacialis]
MKKFRKVLDGLTTSSPGGTLGSPSYSSAAGTPTASTPREIDVQETLVSENFQLCKRRHLRAECTQGGRPLGYLELICKVMLWCSPGLCTLARCCAAISQGMMVYAELRITERREKML